MQLALNVPFLFALVSLLSSVALSADQAAESKDNSPAPPTLDEVRVVMDKWIETQQIISKERKDWQQGKEILKGRLELVNEEIKTLTTKIAEAKTGVAEADKKRDELVHGNLEMEDAGKQLAAAVTVMEGKIRQLFKQLPEPLQTKLQPLYQRVPENPEGVRIAVAERFQNILGILNELNKANSEITASYEVHNLADGKPAEVQAFYVGLAQAYYVSARGEAGVGKPTADGWQWQPCTAAAQDILRAMEILQGKQTPAFVPLPVELK